MKTEIFAPLIETLVTKHEADAFLAQLVDASDSLYEIKGTLEDHLGMIFSREQKAIFMQILEQEQLTKPEEIQALFLSLREYIEDIPMLELSIPIIPTEAFLFRIRNWIETSVKTKVFFKVIVDESLIAGVRISYQGKYHDYSLAHMLQT